MVKKIRKKYKEKKEVNKNNNTRKIRKKFFKNSLRPKIDILINYIKKYRNPNEYIRQDQNQKLLKYMKLKPIEFIK